MATEPRALVARFKGAVAALRDAPPPVPAAPPGYRAPEPERAADLLAPPPAWPLVWVTDIAGWTPESVTRRVGFTLTHGARYTGESAEFRCMLPADEAELFDPKHGKYVVIALPATSRGQVARILALAGKREAR
jgi:hypothetical protein